MDNSTRQKLFDKNQKLIDMVIERAKRDFCEDIDAIGLIGSFTTNEYHEKSDLDLVILINNDKGWGIRRSFIFDDVGYDIYCTSWEKVSTFTHMEIYYCSKPEYRTKIEEMIAARQKELCGPIGKKCIEEAKKSIDLAKQNYASTVLADTVGSVRYESGKMLNNLINAVAELNNKAILKYGVRKYFETLLTFDYLPKEFEKSYTGLVEAKTIDRIKQASFTMLKSVAVLYEEMCLEFIEKPTPDYDNLAGTYEELWCNYRNKILRSTSLNDKSYTFLVAVGVQDYLDEMTNYFGTKKIDVMQYYDADNLIFFREKFLKAMEEYLSEYKKAGRRVEEYDTFEALYAAYMSKSTNSETGETTPFGPGILEKGNPIP